MSLAVSAIFILILLHVILTIPALAAGARRLHDIDKTGWWQFLSLTIIGIIPLIHCWTKKRGLQANRYGQIPNSTSFWQT